MSKGADRRIRVGIIGANPDRGWAAQGHIPALTSLSDDFEITALSTTRRVCRGGRQGLRRASCARQSSRAWETKAVGREAGGNRDDEAQARRPALSRHLGGEEDQSEGATEERRRE